MVRGIVLVVLFATLGVVNYSKPEDPWVTTCRLYEKHEQAVVCKNIKKPKIKLEEMRQGLLGYYDGTDTIHINKDLKGKDKTATTIHEMVHYLDKMWLGLVVPGPAEPICRSEDKAWFIEGVWWGIQGHPEKARPDWWKYYPHCWPYYAPAQGFTLTLQEFIQIMGIGGNPVWVQPR